MIQNFEEYIRQGEPSRIEKAQIWQTAIGLQKVDGLTPSSYLIQTAKENIEGDITFEEVKKRIDDYYKTLSNKQTDADDRTEEADKVSARIAEILSEKTFTFSPLWYINIHRRLFIGIYKFAGKIRNYNISKSEWVLDGKTVFYSDADMISATLEYDFKQEKDFSYKKLNQSEIVEHIAKFISDLWQIHAFGEGNTRTTAVFAIKYLRTFGYNVDNDLFAKYSWYFRNALVRANFNDYQNNIHATQEFLLKFFGNLLLGENTELKNRTMHIEFVEKDLQIHSNEDVYHVVEKNTDFVGELSENCRRIVGELSERQVKIFYSIIQNKTISAKKLSELLNTTDRTIEREIKKLKDMKIIERIGSDRGGYWKIINN